MQYHWLNKTDNKNLIIFFTGWSFDYNPFKFLEFGEHDVLMFYDYSNLDLIQIPEYEYYSLISWSMGVFTAFLLKEKLPSFSKKIAINGTPYPIDDENGIPVKPFILTLKHARQGLEGKFYRNIFDNQKGFEHYMKSPVKRSIENRVEELNSLYKVIQNTELDYKKFYNQAIISENDKIVPAKNQINFWQNNVQSYKTLASGHFPFYNFKSWEDILKCR